MAAGRKGTGHYGRGPGYLHQIPARIHKSDWPVVQNWLQRDGIKFQSLVFACVEAYLRRDPEFIRIIEGWKRENVIRRGEGSIFEFSDRERRDILDQIDRTDGGED